MNILGLHVNGGQTSAALLVDGEIRFAAAEERFNRIKQSRDFPVRAIRWCLDQAGLSGLEAVDAVAISWNPAENMRHINLSGFTSWRRYDPEWLYIAPNHLFGMAAPGAFAGRALKMEVAGATGCPIWFVDHHHSHLAHAAFHSPFEEGLVAAVDEYAEFHSVTMGVFRGREIEIKGRIAYPHSLGVFFAAVTEFAGFTPNSDEWKLMGAAAYGDPRRFRPALESVLQWRPDTGDWRLDGRLVEHANMKRAGYGTPDLEALLGLPRRRPDEELLQEHYDLAAAAQAVFETRLFQLLTHYAKLTGQKHLAAAGGCFMNSLANGKIAANTPLAEVFVPYAAADNGGAIGSALHVWHVEMGQERIPAATPPTPYLGPDFGEDEAGLALSRSGLPVRRMDDPAVEAAALIASGRVVGWVQGRMEFGERALGNRSILANPRDASMKARVNAAVKYREKFRPFAPAVLAEAAGDWFDIPAGGASPYMERVFPVRPERRARIPAVVHADGTGRLQTVTREANPLLHRLIAAFATQTGVPIVLNTSFNLKGEPIVCSPQDAVRTFASCGLDALVVGNLVIEKPAGA